MNATRYLPFFGRLFIGLPFVVSGLSKLAVMTGGLLQLVAYGAGAISIDNRHSKDRAP
jgi:uncharacterized membrane protein YphA (DoxX/SURF4 family)